MMHLRSHLLATLAAFSALLLSCQHQHYESAEKPLHVDVYCLKSGSTFDEFADSSVKSFAEKAGISASVKSCTLLEMIQLAHASSSSNGPDVLIVPYQYLALLASKSIIKPFQFSGPELQPAAISACRWNGVAYGTLLCWQPPLLHVNQNLLPWAVDLEKGISLQQVEQLAESSGDNITLWGVHGEDPGRQAQTIVSWLTMCGGSVVDTLGMPTLLSAKNASALESYAELARGNAMETSRQLDALGKQGKLALWYTHMPRRKATAETHDNLRYGVSSIDSHQQHKIAGTFVGMAACIARSGNNSVQVAELIDYMRNAIEADAGYGYPVTTSYWNTDMRSAHKRNLQNILHSSKQLPPSVAWPQIEPALEQAVMSLLYGQASPHEALDRAQRLVLESMR